MFKQLKLGPRTFRCVFLGLDELKRMRFRIIDSEGMRKFRDLVPYGNVLKAKFKRGSFGVKPEICSPINARFIAFSYESKDGKGIYWRLDKFTPDIWKSGDHSIGTNQFIEEKEN